MHHCQKPVDTVRCVATRQGASKSQIRQRRTLQDIVSSPLLVRCVATRQGASKSQIRQRRTLQDIV
ncbi:MULTISPECIES: hypothetical protein, partial [unclassified Microcoleus]